MSLFIPSILLAVLSTITQPLETNNQALRLTPRPKPGKEPTSWQQPLSAVPLFGRFPKLKTLIGHNSFATLPTPLESDQNLAKLLQLETLLIKRDDLAGPLASGNKLRKLEFLLGDATTKQANHIVTWSSTDSCHAALTAICCNKIGMPCTCMYVATKEPGIPAPQPNIPKQYNAKELTYRGNGQRELALHVHNKEHIAQTGQPLYFIPEGASDVIGALGLASAVGELVKQCKEQAVRLPEVIYITSASAGSAAGLLAGLDLWGLDCTVIIVAQKANKYPREHEDKIEKLYACIMQYLSLLDGDITPQQAPKNRVFYHHGFTTESNAHLLAAQTGALNFFAQQRYTLEPSCAARLWTAFLCDALDGTVAKKRVMLWNTGSITH